MDAYPSEYTQHNLPFILLFGLDGQEQPNVDAQEAALLRRGGFVIKSDLPPVAGERVQQLVREFRTCDGANKPWHSRAVSDQNSYYGFRVRSVGRKYVLPPRKADPPREQTGYSPPSSPSVPSSPSLVLHSPLSPLSSDAPLYPDGLMTPLWLKKHQEYIPAAQISFFSFTNDVSLNSLNDNQLKSDVNQINSSLRSSGYKTRHVVVLVSDRSILDATDSDDRLAGIKRATGLDSKNSLFILPPTIGHVEMSNFAGSVLAALQPYCVEYYRDLTKHARRKKTRGAIPSPTVAPTRGTSQALSAIGWSIRYELKLGIFAEFRQEMDAAGRHYNAVLDALLSPDGVFETTANWSPRWSETRLLADCTAVRLIRTQLWGSTTTLAVQTWGRYRDRMRELIDKRGKGSGNYGWEAWESRWAKVMAELVQRADLPVFQLPPAPAEPESLTKWILNIFAPPEKSLSAAERLPPWHLLHHSGYWHRLAGQHANSRYQLAKEIPDEDRTPPGQSPAAVVASRHNTYETYLCPEPHEEMPSNGSVIFSHTDDVIDKYTRSGRDFKDRQQQRSADLCVLEQARALVTAHQYGDALSLLQPLWKSMPWRKEKWYEMVNEITRTLQKCAIRQKDASLMILTNWELMSDVFPMPSQEAIDVQKGLLEETLSNLDKPAVTLAASELFSPLDASFTFHDMEGHVADHLRCQLALISRANSHTTPHRLTSVRVGLDGAISSIELTHDTSETGSDNVGSQLRPVVLDEKHEGPTRSSYTGTADLTLNPGTEVILEMEVIFRDAGNATIKEITVAVDEPQWRLTQICEPDSDENINAMWWREGLSGVRARRIPRREDGTLKVLPKPPKLEISVLEQRKAYFTSEIAVLGILFVNAEDEDIDVEVDISIVDGSEEGVRLSWATDSGQSPLPEDDEPEADSRKALGKINASEQRQETLRIFAPDVPSDCILQIRAIYYLASDTDTPVSKAFRTQLNFVSPFEANYDFAPRVHPDPWPSYFTDSSNSADNTTMGSAKPASGLQQRWALNTRIASFADEALTVTAAELVIGTAHGSITAMVVDSSFPATGLNISPSETKSASLTIDIQKLLLEDRRASALETSLKLSWTRSSHPDTTKAATKAEATTAPTTTTTTLRVPRLLIPQLEPRVLASATLSPSVTSLKHLSYSIENPTIHFLTFDLTLDASEDFAVGGGKVSSLNVLPMSRVGVGFRVVPLVRGKWVGVNLKVTDRYFNKTLRVFAGDGVRDGKEGQVELWVDAEPE